MTDHSVRNLANLRRSASTSRVLNLLHVWHLHGRSEAWKARPMFLSPILNKAMIIKHRLRRHEVEQFRTPRHTATKVVLPIDDRDLRVGGRYLFVDQTGFDRTMEESFGIGPNHPDRRTLSLIDALPGLDPFLLREQLRRNGISPAPCYFNLSDADVERMNAFVCEEIAPLVDLSLGTDIDLIASDPVARLTAKIMSSEAGDVMSALGATLQLAPDEYEEGIFCWKGFLYYKWCLRQIMGEIGPVAESLRRVRPVGRVDAEQRAVIDRAREQVRHSILVTCDSTADMLRVYDDAFRGLTQDGRPMEFRDFLLDAPLLFARLGERLGTIQHIVSFWNYRIRSGQPAPQAEELIDLLADFESSLSGRELSDTLPIAA